MAGASCAGPAAAPDSVAGQRGPGAFMDNLRQPVGSLRKLGLVARNLARRLRGRGCCGHPGEPGC